MKISLFRRFPSQLDMRWRVESAGGTFGLQIIVFLKFARRRTLSIVMGIILALEVATKLSQLLTLSRLSSTAHITLE